MVNSSSLYKMNLSKTSIREQYCIHTSEKIRSRLVIRMIEQQEMSRVFYLIICGTQRVESISKVMSIFIII